MIIDHCTQGSEAWDELRKGKLTASKFAVVLGTSKATLARWSGEEPPADGFGRAKKQAESFQRLLVAGYAGIPAKDVPVLDALVDRGLAVKVVDNDGCTLKGSATADHIDRLIAEKIFTPAELGDRPPNDAMERGNYYEGAARTEFEVETGIDVEEVGFVMHEDLNLVGMSPDGLTSDGGLLEIKCRLPANHLGTLRRGTLPAEYRPQVHGQMAIAGVSHCWFVAYCPRVPTLILRVNADGYTANLLECLHQFEAAYIDQLGEFEQIKKLDGARIIK